jgi:hypothetical protein
MVDRDKFRELYESGFSGAEIARKLGITRQRVSYLAKQMGIRHGVITQPRAIDYKIVYGAQSKPSPIKGAHISHTACGKASELIVAADLTARGWNVYLPLFCNKGFDLAAFKDGVTITVEVRSSRKVLVSTGKPMVTKRRDQKNYASHYAAVCGGCSVHYEPSIDPPE